MKDRRVLRGKTATYQFDGAVPLLIDDGNYNNAWRVVKFVIAPSDITNSSAGSRDCVGVLATHAEALEGDVSTVVGFNWEDRRQIAWTAIQLDNDTTIGNWSFGLIDPQHVIVRDLYLGITALTAFSATEFVYFIEIERVKLDDNQAVMAIIQEEAQDVS